MSDINISKIKRIDGTLLLIFRELMRYRRTTIVAERLGLTQSAISHALTRLRDLFDDSLFIRRPAGLEPTQLALEIAPRIDSLLEIANETLGAGKKFEPQTTRRTFRIGSGDFMSTLVAGPLLNLFEREAPAASFAFKSLLGQQALDALRHDEIDVAIGRFSALPNDIVIEHLYDDGYCVVARDPHPSIHGSIDLETFSQLSHVVISMNGDLAQLGDEGLRNQNVERHIVAAVPRFLTAFTLIAQSNAILTVQRRLAARYCKEFRLQLLSPPHETKSFSIIALKMDRSRNDPAIAWLIDTIRRSAIAT